VAVPVLARRQWTYTQGEMVVIAFKLFRVRNDGTLGPLFIDTSTVVPVGQWLTGKCVPTKGFAVRQGWHAASAPVAPHLALRPKGKARRVWCKVELAGTIVRKAVPKAQGAQWLIAQRMRVIEVLHDLQGITYDNPGPDKKG
jgi:hypothetical protein